MGLVLRRRSRLGSPGSHDTSRRPHPSILLRRTRHTRSAPVPRRCATALERFTAFSQLVPRGGAAPARAVAGGRLTKVCRTPARPSAFLAGVSTTPATRSSRSRGATASSPTPCSSSANNDSAHRDPWVIASNGSIWHRSGVTAANPNGTEWAPYGTGSRDIGVGPGGSVWTTGPAPSSHIFQQRIQPGVAANCSTNPANCVVEAQNHFYRTDGAAAFITVGADALPWVVAGNGSVWRRRR